MKIIKPYFEILDEFNGISLLKKIERCGRVCYKSEQNITDSSCIDFVKNIIERGHESVLEHVSISVLFVCDRGVSHEIVRHRLASYSQESTRYCNYSNEKFGEEITIIDPCFWDKDSSKYQSWKESMQQTEAAYFKELNMGAAPQEARSILPNSLKTEIVMTANLREWRHFFKLRTSKAAHPQMRELSVPLLEEFKKRIPVVFDDIYVN